MPNRSYRLVHPRSGRVLAERLRLPRTFVGRSLGLMFRRSLGAGEGLWLRPCNGIHMFFVRFPIDAVFLDRSQRVVRAYPGLKPWRVVPFVRRAHSVVEVPAGTIAGLDLEPGEPVEVTRTAGPA
jgi:uncharacterized membrane protein (UPF0127 family)